MLNQAKEILNQVTSAGFDQAEVSLSQKRFTEMQIDAGEVTLLRTTDNVSLMIRALKEGRYATISLNQTDDGSLKDGLQALLDAAKAAPIDSARQLAPNQGPLKYEDGPEEPEFDKMYSRIDEFGTFVSEKYPELLLEQSGVDHTSETHWTVNSKQLQVEGRQSYYNFGAMFSAKRGHKVSSFNFGAAKKTSLADPLLEWGQIRNNIESAIKEIDHEPFNGKFVGPIVLTPDSLGGFLSPFLSHLSNDRLISGTSVLREKINHVVSSPLLTIKVNPTANEIAIKDFVTADGYKCEPSVIVDKGVLKGFMVNDYGARKTGLERSKNSGYNLNIEPGRTSREELLKKVVKGLWLGRFSGGYPAANGDFSGVAKNSFLIENGKLTQPLSEVMISGNIFKLFESVLGVSSETMNDGIVSFPWIFVDGVTIAGK